MRANDAHACFRCGGAGRRATFAALVKLLVMPHRDPADALALLEVARDSLPQLIEALQAVAPGPRPALRQAMNELMPAYGRWLPS